MQKQNLRKRKRIWTLSIRIILRLLVLLFIMYNLLYFVSDIFNAKWSLFGINFVVVDTNSMKPELKQKDLIIVKKIKAEELKQNDIILYSKNGNNKITRIKNVHENKGNISFAIKGDNNYYMEEILSDNVQGKVTKNISGGAAFINIFRSKITTVLIIILEVLRYYYKRKLKSKSKNRRELREKMREGPWQRAG